MTAAPSASSDLAMTAPIPFDAPVTTATLPASLPMGVPFRRVWDERREGCSCSSEDPNYCTIRCRRLESQSDGTVLPPLARGDHRRGDPACARGPGAGGALCRERGLRQPAELLEPGGHQRDERAQVDPLAALQGAARSRPDPQ